MAKLTRERKLMERRLDKKARKDARKHSAAHPSVEAGDFTPETMDQAPQPSVEQAAPDAVVPAPADA